MKRIISSSYGQDMSFNEYLDATRYPGFAESTSGLSDEEFYELEDEYREWQKSERPVKGCGVKASEYDNLDDDYSPFAGESYYVAIGDDHLVTSNPAKAIELWFKGEKKYPMDCAIVAKSKLDGINLLEAAKDVIQQMYHKYGSPYKLEYLVDMILKKLNDNLRFFHESEYGDQVDPFSYG